MSWLLLAAALKKWALVFASWLWLGDANQQPRPRWLFASHRSGRPPVQPAMCVGGGPHQRPALKKWNPFYGSLPENGFHFLKAGQTINLHRNSRVYCAMDGRNVARLRTSLGSSSNELTQLNPAEPMVVTDPRAFVVAHFAVTKVMDWLRIKDGDQELLSEESSRSPCREFYHPVLPHAAEEPLQTSGAVESVQHSDVQMRDSDEENLDLTLDQQVEQHTILTTVSAQKGRWEVRRTPQEVFNVGLDMEALFAAERQHEFTGEATNHALASFFAMLPTGNEDHLRKKPGELDKMYQRARAEGRRLVADAAIIGRNPIICLIPLDAYGTRHFRSGPAVKALSKVMGVLKECIDEHTIVEKARWIRPVISMLPALTPAPPPALAPPARALERPMMPSRTFMLFLKSKCPH